MNAVRYNTGSYFYSNKFNKALWREAEARSKRYPLLSLYDLYWEVKLDKDPFKHTKFTR